MLAFVEGGKPEYQEKKKPLKWLESTTNSTHKWHWAQIEPRLHCVVQENIHTPDRRFFRNSSQASYISLIFLVLIRTLTPRKPHSLLYIAYMAGRRKGGKSK